MDRLRITHIPEKKENTELWSVAEVFSEAKDTQKGNEDGYFISDNCIAVFDGVSSVDPTWRINGLTPGQFAVKVAHDVLQEHSSVEPEEITALFTKHLKEALAGHQFDGRPSLVFVAYFPKRGELVRVGDCSYLIDGQGHNPGLAVDKARAIVRKRGLEKELAEGVSTEELRANDPMREKMSGFRAWQEHFSNNPQAIDFGYGVIDGTDVPGSFIERIAVPPSVRSIILASDGYPTQVLRGSLVETEAALQKLQAEDPLGITQEISIRPLKPEQGKQHATDDRTYLRIERGV